MAGGNDLSGNAIPPIEGKLWIMPVVLELFALPFAWISVQMLHDHERWADIAVYALTGTVLCIAGVVWAVFRKRIAGIWPWTRLKAASAELVKARRENAELSDKFADLESKLNQLRSESVSIAVNGKLVAGPAAFDAERALQVKPSVQLVGSNIAENQSADYPLKMWLKFRNESSAAGVAVRVANFTETGGFMMGHQVPLRALQVELPSGEWWPEGQGGNFIAVLPGQVFRAWVGFDKAKIDKDQLEQLRGRIGTFTLSVNGQPLDFPL